MALEYNKIELLKLQRELTAKLERIKQITHDQVIYKYIEAMREMIDELSASSLGISDIALRSKQAINVAAILKDLCSRYQQDGYNVALMTPQIAYAICFGNKVVLSRIFENLIVNAIRHGQIARVYLKTHDNSILVIVEDEGPGILAHEKNKVFEPFYRGQNAVNTRGSGVGLAFVKYAVESYHGSIKLENLPSRGLQAMITLPDAANQNNARYKAQPVNLMPDNQAYLITLAALSHDIPSYTTKIRLRVNLNELLTHTKEEQINAILDDIEKTMKEILTSCKKNYLPPQPSLNKTYQ